MSNKKNMDSLFRERLRNFGAKPPQDAFMKIQKKLRRRRQMKYFYVGGLAVALLTTFVFVKMVWDQPNAHQAVSNSAHQNTPVASLHDQSVYQNHSESDHDRLIANELQNVSAENRSKNQLENKVKTKLNHLGNQSVNQLSHQEQKPRTSTFSASTPKLIATSKKVNVESRENTLIENTTNRANHKFSEEAHATRSGGEAVRDKRIFLQQVASKKPMLLLDSLALVQVTPCVKKPEIFTYDHHPNKKKRKWNFAYEWSMSQNWKTGMYNPYQYITRYKTDFTVSSSTYEEEEFYTKKATNVSFRVEISRHQRLKWYASLSMIRFTKRYTKIKSVADEPDPPIYFAFRADSLQPSNNTPPSFTPVLKITRENQSTYVGINQGLRLNLLQGKKYAFSMNLDGGIYRIINNKVTLNNDQNVNSANTKIAHYLFNVGTGLNWHQKLSNHWAMLGGVHLSGFDGSTQSELLYGVRLGLRWQ